MTKSHRNVPRPAALPAIAPPPKVGASGLDPVDSILLLLVNEPSVEAVRAAVAHAAGRLGIAPTAEAIDEAIRRAREKLAVAATVNRNEELGRAHKRLHALYRSADKADDVRGALAAQRELNRLLGLYPAGVEAAELSAAEAGEEAEASAGAAKLAEIHAACDRHLERLRLTDDVEAAYPDVIALAAREIRRLRRQLREARKPKRKAKAKRTTKTTKPTKPTKRRTRTV